MRSPISKLAHFNMCSLASVQPSLVGERGVGILTYPFLACYAVRNHLHKEESEGEKEEKERGRMHQMELVPEQSNLNNREPIKFSMKPTTSRLHVLHRNVVFLRKKNAT